MTALRPTTPPSDAPPARPDTKGGSLRRRRVAMSLFCVLVAASIPTAVSAQPPATPDPAKTTTTPIAPPATPEKSTTPPEPDSDPGATTPPEPNSDPGDTTTDPEPGDTDTDTDTDGSTAEDTTTGEGSTDEDEPTTPEPPAAPTTPTPPPAAPATPPAPPARNIKVLPKQIEHILATIRYVESQGGYTLPPNRGNASGAYQFIGSTWNNYAGYPHAYLAPWYIQDERAAKDVDMFLDRFDDDVSMVPVMWYYPAASKNPALMDIVPVPSAGNILTVREYQTRWLNVFATMSGQRIVPRMMGPIDLSALAGFAPEVPASSIEAPAMSFPVLGPSRVAIPECDGAEQIEVADNADGSVSADGPSRADNEAAGLCTPQAPGIVFGVKLQPVLAVADGVVTDVRNDDGAAITVTVTGPTGSSYVYSGFNDDNPGTADGAAPDHLRLSALAQVGRGVRAGQILGFMGDTDPLPIGIRADVPTDATVEIDPDAVAPHIRITAVDIDGNPVDAFGPMIDALFRQSCRVMIGQWSIPANGSDHEPVTIETTDDDDEIDSQWVITSDGRVHATGWAALVNPSENCGYAPDSAFGPGAGGSAKGLAHWLAPIELSTDVWISLALQDENTAPGFFRR